MIIDEITSKTLLRKHKRMDSWFVCRYGMNLYRGCIHDCAYCDGRTEKYRVEGEFGQKVEVKVNGLELLKKEITPTSRRKPLKPGFFFIGGGVGDSYQEAEKKYGLTRKVLELLLERNRPIHILTKSSLVERDLDIIKKIAAQSAAIVSCSFSSVDDEISKWLEPGCSPPSERLATLARFKKAGIPCGMYMLPVIPMVTDTDEQMERTVAAAHDVGLDFVVFGGMTLKAGRQKDHFLKVLSQMMPGLENHYPGIYPPSQWGTANGNYYADLAYRYDKIMRRYKIPRFIPPELYNQILLPEDQVMVMLDQMDFLLTTAGRKSPYGYASRSISKLEVPLSEIRDNLQSLRGVGPVTEKIIKEILDTGSSNYHRKILLGEF